MDRFSIIKYTMPSLSVCDTKCFHLAIPEKLEERFIKIMSRDSVQMDDQDLKDLIELLNDLYDRPV